MANKPTIADALKTTARQRYAAKIRTRRAKVKSRKLELAQAKQLSK